MLNGETLTSNHLKIDTPDNNQTRFPVTYRLPYILLEKTLPRLVKDTTSSFRDHVVQ